jgi:purine nucleosidase
VPKRIILDCDPGVDDAWAIVFAAGDPELELCGLTTVAGNASLADTTANALRVCEFIGADVPVVAGSPLPERGMSVGGRGVHGAGGLGGARLPEPASRPRDGHAVDFLLDTVGAAPGEITLVATGPLTNIAQAVRKHPRLTDQVREFVIMGGSAGRGNITPAAEFNIAADHEAAATVFGAGWTVGMVGLDVTLRARAGAEALRRMATLGPLTDDLLVPALAGYLDDQVGEPTLAGAVGADDMDGRPMHDVCAVALVSRPDVFGCRPARVEVETEGRWTTGMTVTDFQAPPGDHNARVAMTIDTTALWDLVLPAYARVADRMRAAQ